MSVDTALSKSMSETQRLQNLSEDELSTELLSQGVSVLLFGEILRRYQKQIYYHQQLTLVLWVSMVYLFTVFGMIAVPLEMFSCSGMLLHQKQSCI